MSGIVSNVVAAVADVDGDGNGDIVLAPNPGRIHTVLPVDFPFPRTSSLRERPEFEELVGRASHVLREALVQ